MRKGLLSHAWVGMLLFGIINLVIGFLLSPVFFRPNAPNVPIGAFLGILYLLAIGGLAWGIYYLSGSPGVPAGMVFGFAVLTLASDGSCTLFTRPGPNYAWVNGAFLYVIALFIGLVVAVIERIVQRNDPDD